MNSLHCWNQGDRRIASSSVAALGIGAVLLVAGLVYLRSGPACASCEGEDATPPPLSEDLDWIRLSATTLDGSPFPMTHLAGRPAVLYFWATWCPQCKAQRDMLTKLAAEWGDRVRIAALSVDDDASAISGHLKGHAGLSQELRASPELLKLFNVEALPTLAAIDATGRVKTVSVGPTDAAALRNVVEPLLK